MVQNLRPSTQVDYGESTDSRGKSSTSEGADHQLDHGLLETIPDTDLTFVTAAWPRLPESVRAGILAMVKATLPADGKK